MSLAEHLCEAQLSISAFPLCCALQFAVNHFIYIWYKLENWRKCILFQFRMMRDEMGWEREDNVLTSWNNFTFVASNVFAMSPSKLIMMKVLSFIKESNDILAQNIKHEIETRIQWTTLQSKLTRNRNFFVQNIYNS